MIPAKDEGGLVYSVVLESSEKTLMAHWQIGNGICDIESGSRLHGFSILESKKIHRKIGEDRMAKVFGRGYVAPVQRCKLLAMARVDITVLSAMTTKIT